MTNDRKRKTVVGRKYPHCLVFFLCVFFLFLVGLKYFLNITYVRKYLCVVKLRFIHVFFLNFHQNLCL